jgi:hypothetical protein
VSILAAILAANRNPTPCGGVLEMLDSFEAVAIIAVSAVQTPAQVAKLVDALGSGPSGGNTVEVRVLSWAPDSKVKPLPSGFTFCVKLCGSFEVALNE